ncbi:MAG: NAD-dependent epimerase/dehydratase family protein [Deltaproteobacteria bacterium]|nr:NAD-dependent epimerase/dehydratase family protein [Deltaproteobacteria bacterium]MBW2414979.1 NAD-dependent epimerase/dehydratase family protein [Deltaproteobacteria bacterium]
MQKVLITGIASGLGRLVARRLRNTCQVVGADRDQWTARLPELPFYRVDLRARGFEEVFRAERPDAVVHLGFVRHFRASANERYDVNVRGTRRLLDHCRRHGVKRVLVLSTSYVYGAMPENPCFMDEEYPLSASRNYPEIRDLVEVDTIATSFMWRHVDIDTSVIRPVPTLGYYVESTIGSYLRTNPVVVAMGFDPMMQFLHEDDLAEAVALSVEKGLRGVYNLAGPGQVPLRVAIRETGGRALPLPDPVLRRYASRVMGLPSGAIDFIKFPCTIDGARFVRDTGFRPQVGLKEAFRGVRRV